MPTAINTIGRTFGKLTVLGDAPPQFRANGKPIRMMLCRCACGREIVTQNQKLLSGHTTSCGCQRAITRMERHPARPKPEKPVTVPVERSNSIRQDELVGKIYGFLTVVGIAEPFIASTGYPVKAMLCRCQCGIEKRVRCSHLTDGRVSSCGSCAKKARIKHGNARRNTVFPRTYRIWRAMVRRCTDEGFKGWPKHGGRGITVCERWRDFNNFLADMRECPDGMSIDRIDNNGHYEPGNCRWATSTQQSRNKSATRWYTIDGRTLSLAEWCEIHNMNYMRVWHRLHNGWSVQDALSITQWSRNPSGRG